jgi:hypothetical protein
MKTETAQGIKLKKDLLMYSHSDMELFSELFSGARIITDFLFPEKGYALIERKEPLLHSNGVGYQYAVYLYRSPDQKFYKSCDLLKSKGESVKSVINRAFNHFYKRD